MRNGLAAGGWSTTRADLPCFVVALTNGFVHSPKTPAMQLARRVKLDGDLRAEICGGKQAGDLPCVTLQCFVMVGEYLPPPPTGNKTCVKR